MGYVDFKKAFHDPTVDENLKVLEGMGLVEKRRIGKEVFHTVSLERLLELSNAQR